MHFLRINCMLVYILSNNKPYEYMRREISDALSGEKVRKIVTLWCCD